MANFIDFKTYLQNELGDKFEVTDELNNDYILLEKTPVVVRTLAGNVYDASAQIPYQLDIFTDKPKEIIDFFTNFAKTHNNTIINSVVQEGDEFVNYSIVQNYTTPVVMQSDVEFGTQHYSRVVIFPTLFVMYNINNVKALKINDEPQEILNGSLNYTTELQSSRVSGANLNVQNKKTATTSLTFTMLNKTTIFGRNVALIRQGKEGGNLTFDVEITLTDDSIETYKMIITTAVLSFARASLPSLNITMMIARE